MTQWQVEYPIERNISLSSRPAFTNASSPPRKPVDRICRVLEKIGALLSFQVVRSSAFFSLPEGKGRASRLEETHRCNEKPGVLAHESGNLERKGFGGSGGWRKRLSALPWKRRITRSPSGLRSTKASNSGSFTGRRTGGGTRCPTPPSPSLLSGLGRTTR